MEGTKKHILDFFVIFIGCILIGMSFNAFFDRYGMAPGGLSGLFVIINKLFHIELWISNLLFNIPLYILAFKFLSREECIKTLWGILCCSLGFKFTGFLAGYATIENKLFACIIGGIFLGTGTGIIFKAKGSTGGTGLLALILNRFLPQLSTPKFMGIADGIVVLLSVFASGKVETGVYSLLALLCVVWLSDWIIGTKKKGGTKADLEV